MKPTYNELEQVLTLLQQYRVRAVTIIWVWAGQDYWGYSIDAPSSCPWLKHIVYKISATTDIPRATAEIIALLEEEDHD